MVGLVLVSHSRSLALAVQELVRSMTGPKLPLAIAAGVGDDHAELGTDAVEISEAILSVQSPEGVLVLMDMGSAILSAETALDLLDEPARTNIRFCPAPFVEGAVAAGVTANLDAPMEDVYREAMSALQPKQTALAQPETGEVVAPKPPVETETSSGQSIRLMIRNEHGLHARPAARLINETRPFHSQITVRNLTNQRGPVSIHSLSLLASLEILRDNEIEVNASGDDAARALEAIAKMVESGFGEALPNLQPDKSGKKSETTPTSATPPSPITDGGLPVSEGIACGEGFYFQETAFEIPQDKIEDVPAEIERLQKAITQAQATLETRRAQMSATVGNDHAEIYEAQILSLQDPELSERAFERIRTEKENAALAWSRVNQEIVGRYKALQDPYLRERAVDLQDVGRQVIELLTVQKAQALDLPEPRIILAEDLTPHQISQIRKELALGVILLDGGPTAHSSILLRALGIPTVVQARWALEGLDSSHPGMVALDGSSGKIWLHPDPSLLKELEQKRELEQQRRKLEIAASSEPGATRDGERIEIFANLGKAEEADSALQNGAEGVGLFRTEFLFLERSSAPTEEEQVTALRAVAQKMDGRPVIVRTLDAGGDKELPYLHRAAEDNPFLGVRAVRLCFAQPDLFATQLRAILRAGHGYDFRIMFPMIADVTDLATARKHLEAAHQYLASQNVPHLWPVSIGIMIEIPSAALQAEALAEQVDFFSIGTNDLTQYTLAADRGNPTLGSYHDALHPAVLALIENVTHGAQKHRRLVAICGEAASDEKAAAIFVGLGVRELSMTGSRIGRIKANLKKANLGDLQARAQQALRCSSAAEVRALA